MNQQEEYPQNQIEIKRNGLHIEIRTITPGKCTADCIAAHSQVWLKQVDNNGKTIARVKYKMNAEQTAVEIIPERSVKGQVLNIDQFSGHEKLRAMVTAPDFQDMLTDLLQQQIATALASIGETTGGHNYAEFEDITI